MTNDYSIKKEDGESVVDKIFDIFLGRLDGWHTSRVAQNVSATAVNEWLGKGYRIETEHQIGVRLHGVYLVKV